MAGFPYVLPTNRISAFFDKVRDVNKPAKLTQAWLTTSGFTSKNDRGFISLMKELGYVDGGGSPKAQWDDLRGSDPERKASVGRQMRVGYPEVFAHWPDAYIASSLTKEELKNFIRPKVSAGTIDPIVATFFALRGLAIFDDSGSDVLAEAAAGTSLRVEKVSRAGGTPVSISVSLHLEIPTTTDPDVYDKLFEAMAKHLGTLVGRGS